MKQLEEENCRHANKRKAKFSETYWFCPDCQEYSDEWGENVYTKRELDQALQSEREKFMNEKGGTRRIWYQNGIKDEKARILSELEKLRDFKITRLGGVEIVDRINQEKVKLVHQVLDQVTSIIKGGKE